jgi:hypothetical protein
MGEARRKLEAVQRAGEEHWPQDVELSVGERLWLLSILPREGDIATLRTLRDLRAELAFSDEETKTLNVRIEGTATKWDPGKAKPKTIAFVRIAWELTAGALQDLNKKKKLNVECVELYDKFVKA